MSPRAACTTTNSRRSSTPPTNGSTPIPEFTIVTWRRRTKPPATWPFPRRGRRWNGQESGPRRSTWSSWPPALRTTSAFRPPPAWFRTNSEFPQPAPWMSWRACTGFIYGLETARTYVAAGAARNVLLVGTEVYSKIVNWEDRRTCVLFGDRRRRGGGPTGGGRRPVANPSGAAGFPGIGGGFAVPVPRRHAQSVRARANTGGGPEAQDGWSSRLQLRGVHRG